jgi:hypothetical protein
MVAGVDDRPQGRDALALGAALAEAPGTPLIVASVYPAADVHTPVSTDEQ